MRLNFRQGINTARINQGQPDFLAYVNGGMLSINITTTRLLVTLAYKDQNFLIEEPTTVIQAWGPITWNSQWGAQPSVPVYHFYWDINLATGEQTRSFTHSAPIVGATTPVRPAFDQHWFDTTVNVMKVWNGTFWVERIRVFAGSCAPSTQAIVHRPFGSQVELNDMCAAGFVAYGNDLKAIRLNNGQLMTTETDILVKQGGYSSPVQLEGLSTSLLASEPIPAFYAVAVSGLGQVGLALPNNPDRRAIGVIREDATLGSPVTVITEGVVFNEQWNWNLVLGKDLVLGESGQLVQDNMGLASLAQRVGNILTAQSVLISLNQVSNGLQGPQGPTGPVGPVIGVLGPTGPAGINGTDGTMGPAGVPGTVGPTGPAGISADQLFHIQVGAQGLGHLHTATVSMADLTALMDSYQDGDGIVTFDKITNTVNGHQHTLTISYNYYTGKLSVTNITSAHPLVHTATVATFFDHGGGAALWAEERLIVSLPAAKTQGLMIDALLPDPSPPAPVDGGMIDYWDQDTGEFYQIPAYKRVDQVKLEAHELSVEANSYLREHAVDYDRIQANVYPTDYAYGWYILTAGPASIPYKGVCTGDAGSIFTYSGGPNAEADYISIFVPRVDTTANPPVGSRPPPPFVLKNTKKQTETKWFIPTSFLISQSSTSMLICGYHSSGTPGPFIDGISVVVVAPTDVNNRASDTNPYTTILWQATVPIPSNSGTFNSEGAWAAPSITMANMWYGVVVGYHDINASSYTLVLLDSVDGHIIWQRTFQSNNAMIETGNGDPLTKLMIAPCTFTFGGGVGASISETDLDFFVLYGDTVLRHDGRTGNVVWSSKLMVPDTLVNSSYLPSQDVAGWKSFNFDSDTNILNINGFFFLDGALGVSSFAEGRGLVIRLEGWDGAFHDAAIVSVDGRFMKSFQSNDRTMIIRTSSPDYWGQATVDYTHVGGLNYNANTGNGTSVVSQFAFYGNFTDTIYTSVGEYTGYLGTAGNRWSMVVGPYSRAGGPDLLTAYNLYYRHNAGLGGAAMGLISSDGDFSTTLSYITFNNEPMAWTTAVPIAITSVASTATVIINTDVGFTTINNNLLTPVTSVEYFEGNVTELPRPAVKVDNLTELGALRLLNTGLPAPIYNYGSKFDKKGDIRIDEQYIYICFRDYTGLQSTDTPIWRRIPIEPWTIQ